MFREKLKQLLEVLNTKEAFMNMLEAVNRQIVNTFKDAIADTNELVKIQNKYVELTKANFNNLEDRMLDVYASFYSEEDVDDLLAFYNTRVGKKILLVSNDVSNECMRVGAEFSEELVKLGDEVVSSVLLN